MPVYNKRGILLLPKVIVLNPKDGGPTLPAFLSPAVLKVLVEKFHIAGITTVEEDMKLFFE